MFRMDFQLTVFRILTIGIPEAKGIPRRCIIVSPESKIRISERNISYRCAAKPVF
jgi:hypothetical protein